MKRPGIALPLRVSATPSNPVIRGGMVISLTAYGNTRTLCTLGTAEPKAKDSPLNAVSETFLTLGNGFNADCACLKESVLSEQLSYNLKSFLANSSNSIVPKNGRR